MRATTAIPVMIIIAIAITSYAEAATNATAFAASRLITVDSDFSALRLMADHNISTADISLESRGTADMELIRATKGYSNVTTGIFSAVNSERGLSYMSLYSNVSSTAGVTGFSTNLSGAVLMSFSNSLDPCTVSSTSAGAVLSSPGTDDYNLMLIGGHVTNTDDEVLRFPDWMTHPRMFNVSLVVDPMTTDQPADLFEQQTSLSVVVADYQSAYYNYDFSRTLEIDDVTCSSGMQLFGGVNV